MKRRGPMPSAAGLPRLSRMAAAPPDTHFVIARYDEPIGWLADLGDVRLTVYNKGPSPVELPQGPAAEERRAPNRGREGETYLRHILNHYDELAEVTVFSQARITDHLAAWVAYGVYRDRRFASEAAFLHFLAAQAAATGLSEPTERVPVATDDANWRSDWNRNHLGVQGEWFMQDRYRGEPDEYRGEPDEYRGEHEEYRGGHITFHDWFERFVGPYPGAKDPSGADTGSQHLSGADTGSQSQHPSGADTGLFCACSCGIFAVRRDRILARPRDYYAALRNQVSWHADPVEGHFLERSWYYIFGGGVTAAKGAGADQCAVDAATPSAQAPPACPRAEASPSCSSLADSRSSPPTRFPHTPSQLPHALHLRAAPPVDPASPRVIFCAFGPSPPPHLESVLRVAAAQHRVTLLADRASVRLASLPGVEFVDATRLRHATKHLCAKYIATNPAPDPHEWAALERLIIAGRYMAETFPPRPEPNSEKDPPVAQSAFAPEAHPEAVASPTHLSTTPSVASAPSTSPSSSQDSRTALNRAATSPTHLGTASPTPSAHCTAYACPRPSQHSLIIDAGCVLLRPSLPAAQSNDARTAIHPSTAHSVASAPSTPPPSSQYLLILDTGCVLLRPLSSAIPHPHQPHASLDLKAVFCDATFCQRFEACFETARRIDAEWRRRTLRALGAADLRAVFGPVEALSTGAGSSTRCGNGQDGCVKSEARATAAISGGPASLLAPAPDTPLLLSAAARAAVSNRALSVFLLDGCCAQDSPPPPASLYDCTSTVGEDNARSDSGALAPHHTRTQEDASGRSSLSFPASDVSFLSLVASRNLKSEGGYVRFMQRAGRNFAVGADGREYELACVWYGVPPEMANGNGASGESVGEERRVEAPCGGGREDLARVATAGKPQPLSLEWLRQRLALPPLLLGRSREVAMRSRCEL